MNYDPPNPPLKPGDQWHLGPEQGFTYSAASKRYGTIFADPPWWESGGGKVKRGADRHYPLMRTAEICALPVGELALPDSHLYLWGTNNHLPDAFEVIKAWGFKYVTCITWGKMGDRGIQEGLGQYFRGSSEQLLFCRRGQPPYRVKANGKRAQGRTLYLAPRTEQHSEKPECFREVIERVSAGPYLEMFARRAAPGWDLWGNQAPGAIALPPVGWRKFTDGLGTFPPGADLAEDHEVERSTTEEHDHAEENP